MTNLLLLLPMIALAKEPSLTHPVKLSFFHRDGKMSCDTELVMKDGVEYLACSRETEGDDYFLRVTAKKENEQQTKFIAKFEKVIGTSGEIVLISNPKIISMIGEKSTISESLEGEGEPTLSLSVIVGEKKSE